VAILLWQNIKRGDVLAVVVALPIDGTSVMKRKRLENVDEDPAAKD
jgi:hypothetical protein